MLIIMLAAVVLSVTTVSRRVTARYPDYVGLYDLAVAGNEQALFLLRQAFDPMREYIINRVWQRAVSENIIVFMYYNGGLRLHAPEPPASDTSFSRGQFRRIFIEEAMRDLEPAMGDIFYRVFFDYRLNWGIDAAISAGGFAISDSYRATTNISVDGNRFNLDTHVRRDMGDYTGAQATVEASIIWTVAGQREIILDAYTIVALVLAGVEIPITPNNGENLILFLDEFALTMVESLRR